jgi:hypothetical protein
VGWVRAAPGPKYKAALSAAYGAGLRVSEVVALKVSDVDSERMLLRIEQGQSSKDQILAKRRGIVPTIFCSSKSSTMFLHQPATGCVQNIASDEIASRALRLLIYLQVALVCSFAAEKILPKFFWGWFVVATVSQFTQFPRPREHHDSHKGDA